jgi:hypothetical protein
MCDVGCFSFCVYYVLFIFNEFLFDCFGRMFGLLGGVSSVRIDNFANVFKQASNLSMFASCESQGIRLYRFWFFIFIYVQFFFVLFKLLTIVFLVM